VKIIVTGGCGFIGHHVVEDILKNTDWDIAIFDKLTYAASGYDRLRDIEAFDDVRVQVFALDITKPIPEGVKQEVGEVDFIYHLAAETHVDNSITDPEPFVRSNVLGTFQMLEYAKEFKNLAAFINFSTDEVFGPAPEGVRYKEWDRFKAGNPYSASKAGAVCLGESYHNTYGVPVITTFTMNCIGERQHPEKFVPMVIGKVLQKKQVTIHSNKSRTKAGSRFYIHSRNVAKALRFLLLEGVPGERYNIVGEKELDNLELAQLIASVVGKKLKYKMVDFHSSRPGHDLRYALDGTKLEEMGFQFDVSLEDSLKKTIEWTLEHQDKWLNLEK
jgi:dTDP-glucose 4,6-dehydratase